MISVVIPVYNVEKYVRLCIDSVINQSYNDFEIILVNDGSLDKSGEICDEYASKYENIRVVHKKNEGLGYARNEGIEIAKGKYIVFVDSDDYVEKDMLLDLYKEAELQGCDTCIGGHNRVSEENNFIVAQAHEKRVLRDGEVVKEFIPRMIGSLPDKKDSLPLSAWNVLYSMEIIKNNNIRFVSERELISEDLIFNLEYFKYSKGVSLIEQCNYNYRITANSLTTRYNNNRFEMIKKIYYVERKKIEELGILDVSKIRLYRQFFNYLRMCFKQENIKVSRLKYKEALSNISSICLDNEVKNIVNEYPIDKLDIKQKVFVLLVKYNMSMFIYLGVKLGVV